MILKNLTKYASCLLQDSKCYLRDMKLIGAAGTMVSFSNSGTYTYTTPINGGISLNMITTAGVNLNQVPKWYITLGSGTTQPTFNDYRLESEIANKSSIKYTTTNATFVQDSGKLIFSAVINNTGTEAIDFTEVVLAYFYDSLSSFNNSDTSIALTRDVISPVTVEAGKSKTITVVIDFASMATSVA